MKKKIGIIFLLIALFILVFILYNIFVNNSNNKNESEIVKQEKLNSGKRLSVDIVDYNIKIENSNSLKTLLLIKDSDSKEKNFTTIEMLSLVSSYAFFDDFENFKKNTKGIENEKPADTKFEYLNNLAKEIFGKELVKSEVGSISKDGYISVSLPTNELTDLYKFNELRYDKKTGTYSLFLNHIAPNIASFETVALASTTDYDSKFVIATYKLTYKKENGKNIVLSLMKIS